METVMIRNFLKRLTVFLGVVVFIYLLMFAAMFAWVFGVTAGCISALYVRNQLKKDE